MPDDPFWATVERRVSDENAHTLEEIGEKMNLTISQVSGLAYRKVKAGEWEPAWKYIKGRYLRAYRLVKPKELQSESIPHKV